jgi:hypothetical protein
LTRDLAWQAATGVDIGCEAFYSTVLVGMRNRLRISVRPKRFLDDTRIMARESGVMRDRVRVLDSTPIYDAVTTEDTITQVRAAIRKTLAALRTQYPALAVTARAACRRDDEYVSAGRPPCDWDDRDAKDTPRSCGIATGPGPQRLVTSVRSASCGWVDLGILERP